MSGKKKRLPPRPKGEAELRVQRMAEAMKLRAVDKLSYRAIADKLGVSGKTAYELVQEGIGDLKAVIEQHGWNLAAEKFALLETLQGIVAKHYELATAPGIVQERLEDGEIIVTDAAQLGVQAGALVVKCCAEIAKILGLNAPVRVTGSLKVSDAHKPQPLDVLAERMEKLTSRGDLAGVIAAAYVGREASGKN